MSHATQDLKSAITSRVDPVAALRLHDERNQLGHPATCPASAQNLSYDIYGRPVGAIPWQGVLLNDAACSQFVYPASQRINDESAERPYVSIAPYSLRGAGDFLYGVGRDIMPQNLYGGGHRGDFVRTYDTMGGAPPVERGRSCADPTTRWPVPTLSHDATNKQRYG